VNVDEWGSIQRSRQANDVRLLQRSCVRMYFHGEVAHQHISGGMQIGGCAVKVWVVLHLWKELLFCNFFPLMSDFVILRYVKTSRESDPS
jgi:hypothetical protein